MDTLSLLDDCEIGITSSSLCIHAPHFESAKALRQSFKWVAIQAQKLGRRDSLIYFPGCVKPYQVPAGMAITDQEPDENEGRDFQSQANNSPQSDSELSQESPQPTIESYGAARISPFAKYEAIEDFVRGQRAEGKIVTVMSMGTDKFLKVNDLQIQERAGGWTMDDWVGTDAKQLWLRSLRGTLPGRVNYYQQLIDLVTTDHYIPEYNYLIDRPNNGGLWEDVTTYHYAEDYGGVAVRIAISTPGQSRRVEATA